MDIVQNILEAHSRLNPYALETPLVRSLAFSQATGAEVWLKLENLQPTGSFKVRGALNKLLSLPPEQLAKGVVAASSGNHGAGVAWGLAKLGAKGIVFVPEGASPTKLEAICRLGAEVRVYGTDGADTEVYAREYAHQNGLSYISPYNDPDVIAGQGTIGVEIAEQMGDPVQPDAVFVTVGGGGMISGIASYLKSVSPTVQMIGCQPENDAAMLASVRAGRIVEIDAKPTISDGSAGGLEPGAITFDLCQRLVDAWVTVSEAEIRAAMRAFLETEQGGLEGAAGVALAAFFKTAEQYKGKTMVVVICGANISPEKLKTVL
jgi:threonine dehydratase